MIKIHPQQYELCFDENLCGNFETNGTFDFKQFKVKKAYRSSNNVEVLIDQFTVAEKATVQIDIKNCSFTVSQILRGESHHVILQPQSQGYTS